MNWTQYKTLLRIEDEDKRSYYIEEACNNNWSYRQLERQINSQLYERLLLSNDKEKVLAEITLYVKWWNVKLFSLRKK